MEKEIKIADSKILYRVYGSGPTIVLVHGFGETGEVWSNQVDFLKKSYRLIVPDLPGSGASEMIDDMSMEGMAEAVRLIIEKERPDTSEKSLPIMIGHSMGGYITLAFAEAHPSELRGMGLFHSSAFADSQEKIATRRKGIEFIRQHGAFEFLKNATPNLFSPRSKDEKAEFIDQFISSLNNFSPQALVSYYESMIKRPDRTSVLKKVKIPVLFVLGKYDAAIPIEDGLKQCHLPEKSYIHVLHESGHMGMVEESDKSNRLLETFFSEN
ncbi:MAG: alpha/beta hydrolase [Chitinophagaceae bacterium]|nr:alpha/beta hydrolase [Chitinophagaceae bacterium]